MDGLFSLLLFAVVFYVMMRFGCGSHMVHGHGGHGGHGQRDHEGHRPGGSADASSVDPVCGMNVAADSGYTKMHQGRQYRFCSRACLDKFEAAPQQPPPPELPADSRTVSDRVRTRNKPLLRDHLRVVRRIRSALPRSTNVRGVAGVAPGFYLGQLAQRRSRDRRELRLWLVRRAGLGAAL